MSLRSKVIITIFPYVLIYEYIPKDITRIIPELIKNVKAVGESDAKMYLF